MEAGKGMTVNVVIRPIEPGDGPMLAKLTAASPSEGAIGFTYEYQADFWEINRAFATDLHGIVAVSGFRIIGMVLGDRTQIQVGGKVCDAAYLSNLCVHPEYQRKGIARRMSDFGFEFAQNILGSDPIFYAAVVGGNVSMKLIESYRFQSTNHIQGGIVPMRRSPPKGKPGLSVRAASIADLDEIAAGMNDFYCEHNLWSPVTPSSLRQFLEKEVAGISPNRIYVVIRESSIVGGLSLSNRSNLVRMRLDKMPFYLSMLGAMLGVIPKSGILNALTVRRVWFREGELNAARYLWEYLRYHLKDQGDSLGIAYDPRDRIADVFRIPFWLPMFRACYVVRANNPIHTERLTYCIAGP